MHTIRSSRSRWTHDEEGYSPAHAIKQAGDDLILLELPKTHHVGRVNQCWRPPDPDWVKMNTDEAIDTQAQVGGAGGMARSHLSFMGAWSKPLPGVTDPFIAEVQAMREGVIFAQLKGYSHVVMEIDCLEVVNTWFSRHNTRSLLAPIFDEIRDKALSFASFTVQRSSRDGNGRADPCAKRATTLAVSECWLDSCPSFLPCKQPLG